MSLFLKVLEKKLDVDEEIWMLSFIEKYIVRFVFNEFDGMCLVVFCFEYRVLVLLQVLKNLRSFIYLLQNNLGYIQKRILIEKVVI